MDHSGMRRLYRSRVHRRRLRIGALLLLTAAFILPLGCSHPQAPGHGRGPADAGVAAVDRQSQGAETPPGSGTDRVVDGAGSGAVGGGGNRQAAFSANSTETDPQAETVTGGGAPLAAPPAEVQQAVEQAQTAGELVKVDALLSEGEDPERVVRHVEAAGGQVLYRSDRLGYLQVAVPAAAAGELVTTARVQAMGIDEQLPLVRPAQVQGVQAAAAGPGMAINLEAMQVPAFRSETGADGSGIVIALVDSGVDPSHPALQQTPDGARKIIDWIDRQTEGDVRTTTPVEPGDQVRIPWPVGEPRTYTISGIHSRSGRLWFGVLAEAARLDLNHNGSIIDQYGVLVADPNLAGHYDTVYVDTNLNQDFTDDPPMAAFHLAGQVGYFGRDRSHTPEEDRTAFVITGISGDGKLVNIGFDGLGHGTHVASVAAGWEPGRFAGVAPGAQLLVVKVVDSDDSGWWFQIARGIEAAAQAGADIINVSLDRLQVASLGTGREWLDRFYREYDALLVLAAGNDGPGLGSAQGLGDADRTLTVGGYFSPGMWERDYHYRLPQEGIWNRSGTGPLPDGGLLPSVVAPFSAPGAVPRWQVASGYGTMAGTSMAAPHVAGAAALLMEAADRSGLDRDFLRVKRALEAGARPVPYYARYEQGYGLVNLVGAWQRLQRLQGTLPLIVSGPQGGPGLLARSELPGLVHFQVFNPGPPVRVNLVSNREWLQPDRPSLSLPAGGGRTLVARYDPPAEPGVYSGMVRITAPEAPGYDMQIPSTLVVPHRLGQEGELTLYRTDVPAGGHYRDFVTIPEGLHYLEVRVRVTRGRGVVRVFRPDGTEAAASGVIGTGAVSIPGATILRLDYPVAGTWEILVESLPELVQEAPEPYTDYYLAVRGAGLQAAPAGSLGADPGAEPGTQPGADPGADPGAEPRETAGGPGSEWPTAPLRFSYAEGGQTVREEVTLRSTLGRFRGHVWGSGLRQSDGTGPAGLFRHDNLEQFTLDESLPLAFFHIQPVPGSPAEAGLELWYRARDQWEIGGAVAPESSPPPLQVRFLPPGSYSVFAESKGPEPRFLYRRQFLFPGQDVRVEDAPATRERGSQWTVTLEMDLPEEPGRYYGHLVLEEAETGQILTWLPLAVSVGEPELWVAPMDPMLVVNEPGSITFRVEEAATGRPVSGPVRIDGRLYQAADGRITVAVTPGAGPFDLLVEADISGYRPLRRRFTLQADPVPATIPVGPEPEQEHSAWRRKVLTELGYPTGSEARQ